jgi:hypothetical protein
MEVGMTALRVALYTDIHKGLRAKLFGVALRAGATDWTVPASVDALREEMSTLVTLMSSHTYHEEEFGHPLIARSIPGAAGILAAEHREYEALLGELAEHLRLHPAECGEPGKVQGRGLEWYRCYSRLMSALLLHFDREESQVMPALREVRTEDELLALLLAILGSMSPDEMVLSLQVMLPAMNPQERIDLFSVTKQYFPPEAFAGASELARGIIGMEQWAAVEAALSGG